MILKTAKQNNVELNHYIDTLNKTNTVNSYYIIKNVKEQTIVYVCPNYFKLMGYSNEKLIKNGFSYQFSKIHPDDIDDCINFFNDIQLKLLPTIKQSEILDYSYSWNYRARNSLGNYVNIQENQKAIILDRDGEVLYSISHCTLLNNIKQQPNIGVTYKKEASGLKTIFYKNYSANILTDNLTTRELTIIKLITEGLNSTEISKKLFLSKHTVNTHRRNILSKAMFKTTSELINYCCKFQIFT